MGKTGGTNMKKLMTLVLAICMLFAAATAFAAEDNFTPSVTAKSAPGVLIAWIEDIETKEIVKELMLDKEIVFTAVADRDNAEDEAITARLNASYEAILNAASLAELGLAGAENMIVRDLFDIALYDVAVEEGQVLKVKFQTNAPHAVAVNAAEWTLGLADTIVDNGDDTITITFPNAGTVAFLVDLLGQNAVTSPAT